MRVEFRVDHAVRGCKAGEAVILDEWAEFWIRSDRYRKGQRVLIFLYPPSGAGFSSPVAGDVGSIHIGADGLLKVRPQQASLLAAKTTDFRPGSLINVSESESAARARQWNPRAPWKVAPPQEAAE